MNIRKNYLVKAETLSDSGTKIINIGGSKPITALELIFKCTNGATSNTARKISEDVTSIKVSDGGRELFSLPMLEAQAVQLGLLKRPCHKDIKEGAAGVNTESVMINFGRWFGDSEFYLSPADFLNLQLKITTAFTVSATVGWATGTGTVSVIAHTIEEGVTASRGYVVTKSVNDYTPAASGDVVVDLPTDYNYLLLTNISRETLTTPVTKLTNIKLSLNNDEYIPIDEATTDVLYRNHSELPKQIVYADCLRANGGTFLGHTFDLNMVSMRGQTDENLMTIDAITAEGITFGLLEYSTPATPTLQTTAGSEKIAISGSCLGGALYHRFEGYEKDAGFLISKYKKATLKLTQGNAGGTGAVILSQLFLK